MNLLQKLTALMEENHDTVASLSRKSEVPYTTIDGLFKKGYANARISTVAAICTAYGVSMDYLIRDEITDRQYGMHDIHDLTDREMTLIDYFRAATPEAQDIAEETLMNHPRRQEEAVSAS